MATILSGITVGSYEIIDRLKRGGMADVYLAREAEGEAPGRRVVLRVIEYGGVDPDALAAERLGAELQDRLCRVDDRVPLIYSWGDLEGCCFYIAMEYVEGEDLADVLRGGTLPHRRAVEIALEVCDSLAIAHGFRTTIEGKSFSGIVHGDIKPKNIRIEPGGGVRILDFGIAKALSLTRKQTRNVFASVAYASPERLEAGVVNEQADLWALGVILYEMVSGRQPFRAETTQRLEGRILSGEHLAPLPEGCPEGLARVIRKALAPDPADRYPQAAAMREDLEAVLEDRMPQAPAAGSTTRRTAAAPERDADRPSTPARNGATRRTVTEEAPRGGETRRTAPPPEESSRKSVLPTERPPQPPARRFAALRSHLHAAGRKAKRGALILAAAAVMLVAVLEAALWSQAAELERDLLEEQIGTQAAWERYRQLATLSPLGVGVRPVREPLKEALLEMPDEVIDQYREDGSLVWEGRWEEAHQHLQFAHDLAPGDRDIEAKRQYVEGHLARIRRAYPEAVEHFREAVDLRSDWPDPYLGLINTYLYGMRDYEQAEETLFRLADLGFPLGKREQAQLADAQYFRGLEQLPACEEDGSDAEQGCLQEAKDYFTEAVYRYETLIPWGRSEENSRHAREQLERIERRMTEIRRSEWEDRFRRLFQWE